MSAFGYGPLTQLPSSVLDLSFGGLQVPTWAALQALTRWAGTAGASQALGTPALQVRRYGVATEGDCIPVDYCWYQASTLPDDETLYTVCNPTGNTGSGRWVAVPGQISLSAAIAASPYQVTSFLRYLGVDNTSGAPLRVNLPGALLGGGALPAGYVVTIADEAGNAGTNAISIYPPSGTIAGAASFALDSNYSWQRFRWNGSLYVPT
jgi:hypothetical protein